MTPIKCLIVDDTPENLVALEALLRRDGLEILIAASGAEALELLLVHEVALALLDVQMPGMDGFELAELMRGAERTRHVPIIFVTAGSGDPARMFRGYDSGAVDFLYKPIDPRILRSKCDVFFELYAQRRALSDALRLNEMFVAIVGHDLRNPLSALIMGAHALDRGALDANQRRVVARMISAGNRMTGLVDQVLDLTRARLAGGIGLADRVPVDVSALVARAVEELRASHPDREVLVEARGDLVAAGDANRLVQLLSNLIGNAVQHGAAGSLIRVTVDGTGDLLCVDIHNLGAIPASLVPTLFDPFRDRGGPSRRTNGLGLGLYIARQIALAHGGDLLVASSEDAGTTFTVRLPRA